MKITDFNAPELDVYTRLSEIQLKTFNEPGLGIFIAESPNVIDRALKAGYEPVSFLVDEKERDNVSALINRCGNIPVYEAADGVLSKLAGLDMTRGALCAMKRKPAASPSDLLKDSKRIVIFEDVMNPTNIGAMFRSAAALNIDAVLLTAGCSDPLYRRSARVSMGTVFQIPWTFFGKDENWPTGGMASLHSFGYKTVSMALCDNSLPIDSPILKKEEKLAIIMGTESTGIRPETLALCDYIVKIPMSHDVDSLNVAAAGAIAFWELGKTI